MDDAPKGARVILDLIVKWKQARNDRDAGRAELLERTICFLEEEYPEAWEYIQKTWGA